MIFIKLKINETLLYDSDGVTTKVNLQMFYIICKFFEQYYTHYLK